MMSHERYMGLEGLMRSDETQQDDGEGWVSVGGGIWLWGCCCCCCCCLLLGAREEVEVDRKTTVGAPKRRVKRT